MPLSVPNLVLAAKQFELQELERLKASSRLVGTLGHMIHALQAERGASSLYLASAGTRFAETRLGLIAEAESIEAVLRRGIEAETQVPRLANAKILSLMAWVLIGLDALGELRPRIGERRLSGEASLAAFSRLIAGLISLIFELADAAIDPAISRLLVALFNLVEGKELAGQERAVGALAFGSGRFDSPLQQRILHLVEEQERCFGTFLEFADDSAKARWRDMEETPYVARLRELRRGITGARPGAALDSNLSDAWFESCSERLTVMWAIQCDLVESLQRQCVTRIAEAERQLQDSEGLLTALRENPPARASVVDRFFDPGLPVEQALSFSPVDQRGQPQARSIIELLQAQSIHLATLEDELASAKRALNERKIIERAKGILMARLDLAEDEAYKQMRTLAMERNVRLAEVAEWVLVSTDP